MLIFNISIWYSITECGPRSPVLSTDWSSPVRKLVRSRPLVPFCPIDDLIDQTKTLITAPKEKLQILLRTSRFRLFVIFWNPNYLLRCHFLNDKWKQIQIHFMVFLFVLKRGLFALRSKFLTVSHDSSQTNKIVRGFSLDGWNSKELMPLFLFR